MISTENLQLANQVMPQNTAEVNVLVRAAEIGDVPELVAMGEQFHGLSGLSEMGTFDPTSFRECIAAIMDGRVRGMLIVAQVNGALVGMAAGVIFPLYFNRERACCQEIFWFCKPDFRNGVGAALLDELESDAKRKGADVFMSAAIAGLRDAAIGRVYQRRGYKPAENTFIRKLSS